MRLSGWTFSLSSALILPASCCGSGVELGAAALGFAGGSFDRAHRG